MVSATPTPLSQLVSEGGGLSADARARFQSNGALLVPQVFDAAEVEEIRDVFTSQVEVDVAAFRIDRHIAEDDILSRYPRFVHPHRHLDTEAGRTARRVMVDKRLLAIAANLIGPTYGAQSMFYFKPPTARGQALHQDNFFLQAHPETCLAAWIAIDDSDGKNGGLEVIPGSHRNDILCREDADLTMSFSVKTVRIPKGVPRVQTELKAGDVLFFHGSLVHGSLPNTSDRFRRTLIFHYIPQASVEVAKFYQPLISPAGEEVRLPESAEGGPCGEGWVEEGH